MERAHAHRGRRLALALAGVLAGLAMAAPAAAAATAVAAGEAEQGVLEGWYMSKVADASAGGGSAVRFDWTGSLRLDVTLPADADAITLRLRGDQCEGAPAYTVAADHEAVGGGTVTSTSWIEQTLPAALSAGSHSLEIRFTNDHVKWWPGGCDRNLYLDAVTFTASATAAPRANPPVPAGFVHQSGTRLLDGAGKPIRLRGVNLGGWLLWEGWLWGQGFDYIGESAMMRNLASLVGATQAEQFRSDVRTNFVTAADFKAMSSYGLTVARVPFNYRLLEDDARPFTYKQAGWDILDRTLAAAKAHDVYLVLDMHAAPCSQMYAFVSDYVGPDYLWSSATCRDRMVALWKAIAARYAKQNIVAGYDLLGETIAGDQELLALYKRTTAAIREVDRNHTIIYEGNYMARTFDLFSAPLDANQMLSFHDYPWAFPGEDLSARMVKYGAAARRLNSPQWAGEFGQSTYADIEKYVDTFDADPVMAGWAQWAWKQVPGFAPLQAIRHTAASKKLIEWINDTSRPRPTSAEATQGMSDFARAIRFENTVHDAKLRRILACEGACTLPPPATAVTAPGAGAAAPAPATADAPAAAPAAPGAVAPAPALTASARRTTLAAALRSGVALRVTLPGPGRLQASARHAGRRVARGARTRTGKVVARGATAAIAAGRRTVTLRFTATARRALRHARRATLNVKVSYRPARGTSLTRRLKLTLAR